ncbi:hypothetical protein HYW60_02330 [Candidatus Kaiserbacteria bacterium]|nr:hypothetical protein [Candidatus Kaiserbacteria bacterium]
MLSSMFILRDGHAVIPVFLISLFLLLWSTSTYATPRPATDADRAAIEAAGLIYTKGMLWDPDSPYVGIGASEAKQYLSQVRCSRNVDVARLDSKFAICAAKFLEELRSISPSACINSAYRNSIQQENACRGICGNPGGCPGKCAPPGRSYHQKGLAIDMANYGNNHQQMWQIAARSGLHNPPGLHRSDPIHIQASSASNCAGISVPLGDGGDFYNDTGRYFPAPSVDYQAPTGQQALPVQPLQQPLLQQPQEQMCTLPDGIQVPCSSIANRGGVPPGGAAGGPSGGPIPPQQSLSPSGQSLSYTQQGERPMAADAPLIPTSSPQSAIEQISKIAYPEEYIEESDVSETLLLALSGSDAYSLSGEEESPNEASSSAALEASSRVAPGPEQTFTSIDLSRTPVQQYPPQELSTLQRALATMKDALLRILAYLRPFGRPSASDGHYVEGE